MPPWLERPLPEGIIEHMFEEVKDGKVTSATNLSEISYVTRFTCEEKLMALTSLYH